MNNKPLEYHGAMAEFHIRAAIAAILRKPIAEQTAQEAALRDRLAEALRLITNPNPNPPSLVQ